MDQKYSLFMHKKITDSSFVDSDINFFVNEMSWNSESTTNEHLYQQLVFKVLNKPKQLISHLQRIYFTYSKNMSDQLYAALVDLLLILDGKGRELSLGLISSSKNRLLSHHTECLDRYFALGNIHALTENRFSIFTQGIIGTTNILSVKADEETTHDPLDIAKDYIEYSQLDAAIEILEKSVHEIPTRLELQTELLELYRVTKNISAFTIMHNSLLEKNINISDHWLKLSKHFSGFSNGVK